jgi:DnaJ like chaperone protein
MGLWEIVAQVGATACRLTGVCVLVEAVREVVRQATEDRKPVTFTVALIALSAKMAKADGIVSTDELSMFRRLVDVPPGEEGAVQRLFSLAQADIAGFDVYAERIRALAEGDEDFLIDVLEGMFHIAAADSYVHEKELEFLTRIGEIFGLSQREFDRVAAGFIRRGGPDPYRVLGVGRSASDDEVKRAWRKLATENHPDRHAAHGLPKEMMAILTDRLQQINAAYDTIRLERGLA